MGFSVCSNGFENKLTQAKLKDLEVYGLKLKVCNVVVVKRLLVKFHYLKNTRTIFFFDV